MNTKLAIVVVVIVLVLGGMYFYRPAKAPTDGVAPQTTSAPVANNVMKNPSVAVVSFAVAMTKSGFVPSTFSVKKGTQVTFVNKDTVAHWPASGPHPVHTCYPGFDALQPIAPGASYSHVFDVAKTCAFHDHLNPSASSFHGSITVTE